MNVATWVAQGLLAFAFLTAGGMELVSPREKLLATGKPMAWVEDFQDPTVKVTGVLEFLGAVGVLLPGLVGIAPVLTPLAAIGLAVVMAGAVVVHIRRHEARCSAARSCSA